MKENLANNETIFQVIRRDKKEVVVDIKFVKNAQNLELLTNKSPLHILILSGFGTDRRLSRHWN